MCDVVVVVVVGICNMHAIQNCIYAGDKEYGVCLLDDAQVTYFVFVGMECF